MAADPSAPDRRFSDSAAAASGRPEAEAPGGFRSILFPASEDRSDLTGEEPDFFADLNLDQVVEATTAGREEYDLKPFFYLPLHDPTAVRYRQDVMRDLERADALESVRGFADAMRRVRRHLAHSEKAHYELERDAWFVDAIDIYCQGVRRLTDDLAERDLASAGMLGLRGYLHDHVGAERFASLAADVEASKQAIGEIRYSLRIQAPRVTVSRYDGDEDYSAVVLETFARFRQGAVRSYLVSPPEAPGMNHIEARIVELVARLNPVAFGRRAEFCRRHRDFLDQTIVRFDREVQFYVAYLELVGRLKAAGLPFCYPHVSDRCKEVAATDTFDLALAGKLGPEGGAVVGNEFHLDGSERMFVVSGPNNGGKTTFARTFGQLHHLAALGLPVPGRTARLFLPDRVFTHFEHEEDIETLRGKFDDELVRVHGILELATSRSVIVMNESFNSTTLNDARFVGSQVVHRILGLGCLGVYVTFVDEIASLSAATVSMVSEVVPENPAQRTFKVRRRPADGLAYAWAIADRYGLTYERLMGRIGA